jgi:hypothetical protein
MEIVNRHPLSWIRPTILVVALAVAALVLGQPAAEAADGLVTTTDSGDIVAPALASAAPTAAPVAESPRATPRGKEIYKGHTLDEIRADPSLLAEVLAEADYIRPINPPLGPDGEPDPPISDGSSDTICPNHVECP